MSEDYLEYKSEALRLAIEDFEAFCRIAGVNDVHLKICMELSKGLSHGQIIRKLKVSKDTVKRRSKICKKKGA